MRESAARLNLTLKQFRYYSQWYAGHSLREIAYQFEVSHQSVSQTLHRAMLSNPSLPEPIMRRVGGRPVAA